jgi:small subunit ribosomal protein S15
LQFIAILKKKHNFAGLKFVNNRITKYYMYLTKEKKQEIFVQFGKSQTNTGSSESQVALFTNRINYLTEHLKVHKKDFSTQRALLKLVGKRRRILDYLKDRNIERYRDIIKSLNLRK